MSEQANDKAPSTTQTLEDCKSKLAASLIPLTNNLVKFPSNTVAVRDFHGILALIDRITKTQLEQEKLSSQRQQEAHDPHDEIEETQAWMKSLGVWMASLEERLNESEVQLQTLDQLVRRTASSSETDLMEWYV